MAITRFSLEVQPVIPKELSRLEELANDLVYSWDRNIRSLFHRLDQTLWNSCGHNPKVFLRRVSQQVIDNVVLDHTYMHEYQRVLAIYDNYRDKPVHPDLEGLFNNDDLVAYFSAEFGVHESLPIYSGGLGILAGDHCKAVSDLGVPFVAVGLLYRQGYFLQTIDVHGNQVAHYQPTDFNDLAIKPAMDENDNELHVTISMPGRELSLRIWLAKLGHIQLVLLDCDLPINTDEDRFITHQLYGGDLHTRIQQEIVLGIGGVRALRKLGLKPNAWHINEGHAAFQILERCREQVKNKHDFATALELVASSTVFTTHTPVAAGHDIFDHDMMSHYLGSFTNELGISMQKLLTLGSSPGARSEFNMTSLALRGSRFHNGVSRIHGGVASKMESYNWPQIPHEDNAISYVTNGVHVQTFLAREWTNLFDTRFREWRNELLNPAYWECIDSIPDHRVWSLQQSLKTELIKDMYQRLTLQHRRNGCSEALLRRMCQYICEPEKDMLVLGFARRFATYKRATLIFSDPERLDRLLNDPKRPVLLIFAGKAHPSDMPGQQLIRTIHEYSQKPEFQGKIILLEGYDMAIARKLVTGVDVWLNTPEYPMEASGTSGEKAGINGVLNLSILDGWWGEGFNGNNGWGITAHGPEFDPEYRNHEEASDLMDILEKEVIPLYFTRDSQGYSAEWVRMCKASMKSIIPQFNAQRMVMDYVKKFYTQAIAKSSRLQDNNAAPAHELAIWKQRVHENWPNVKMRRTDEAATSITHGNCLTIKIAIDLVDLKAEDVLVECLVGVEQNDKRFKEHDCYQLEHAGKNKQGESLFTLDLKPSLSGLQHYKIRVFPHHPLLVHPFETGCMIWL